MKQIIYLALSFAVSSSLALEPQAVTNAANGLIESALGANHACFEFTKSAIELNGWTPSECSEILLLAARTLRNSTNEFDIYRRRNAVAMLGRFGDTNALGELATFFLSDDRFLRDEAGVAFLRIARVNHNLLAPLREEISIARQGDAHSFTSTIYNRIQFDLTYGGLSRSLQRNLLRFLMEQATVETGERAMLDEILCREVPKWRASPQRAENAARMKALHADDAGIVSFFTGIERDAAAARAALAGDGGKDAPGGEAGTQGNRDADDPWADLLDNLPEKKPWEPPKDELSIIL